MADPVSTGGTGIGGAPAAPKVSTPWHPDEGPLFPAAAATAGEITAGTGGPAALAAVTTAEVAAGKTAMAAFAKVEPKFDNGTVNQRAP